MDNRLIRFFFVILYMLILGLTLVMVKFVVVIQLLAFIVRGDVIHPLLRFSQQLNLFNFNAAQYITFNSDQKPFPFQPWGE